MREVSRALPRVLLAFALFGLAACSAPQETATVRAEERDFVHRVSAEGTLVAKESTTVSVPTVVRGRFRLAWRLPDGAEVQAGQVVARFDPSELEQRLEESSSSLRTRGLEIEKSELDRDASLARIQKDLEMAELELSVKQDFQKTDEDLYSRHEIIESRIDRTLAQERSEHAATVSGIQETVSEAQLELLRIEHRKTQRQLDEARQGLEALEVQAPHAGVITWNRDWSGEIPQVGSQVWPGMPLAEIPDLAVMEAEVFVLETDAGGLAVGKAAEVILEARPGKVYPGTITRVSSVAETPFRGSPVQYFGVTISLDRQPEEGAKPGQRVRATLLLDERRDAVVIPRQAVFPSGTGSQVYVQEGPGIFEAREIEIASASVGLVAVGSGLEAGERVAVEPPPQLRAESSEAGAAGLLGLLEQP